jgi:glycosyltransferase involved in cell wall biosynthesis
MKRRFLFFRMGPRPIANEQFAAALSASLPDYEMELVDIRREVRKHLPLLARSVAGGLRNEGISVLASKSSLRLAMDRAPAVQDWIRAFASRRARQGDYDFTMQMQSLFDASTADRPHFVYTDHAMLENTNYEGWDRYVRISPAFLPAEREIYLRAETTFVWSSNVGECLQRQYGVPPGNIRCVGAGGNIAVKADLSKKVYDARTILFVGIDWERKGGPVLVEAFKRVQFQYPRARLIIVGCSPPVSESGIEIAGRRPLDEMAGFYEKASIFCMPSRREPFGNVYVEAMSAGLPVIAAASGAAKDFVDNDRTGYLVPPNDPSQLAEALARLLDQPDRCREFGARGRALALERYQWDNVARRVAETIRERVGAHRRDAHLSAVRTS